MDHAVGKPDNREDHSSPWRKPGIKGILMPPCALEIKTMTVEQNKELVRRYAEEVYNQHNLDDYLEFVGGDLAEHGADHLQQFFTAFPDSQVTILDLFGEGDKVLGRLRINGTHKGPFAGQPPTGKKVQFDSFRIYRIIDGKIIETWAMQDRMGLMEQLGLIHPVGEVNWAGGDDD